MFMFSEHDDRVGGPKHRHRKGRGPFRAPLYSDQISRPRHRGGHGGGGGPGPRARFEDDDGDIAMAEESHDGASQRRFGCTSFNLYSVCTNCGLFSLEHFDSLQIPHGKKYDKQWLLSALQNLCTVPFHAVHYHTDGNKAQFYIDDGATANALLKVSRKITDKDGYKIAVLMNTCPPPNLIHQDLKPEDLEHSHNMCLMVLLCSLFFSSVSDLVSQNIEVMLNRKNSMQAVIKIIEENIPELVCLNLSNNRLYRLDDLADIVNKVPNLKILNLSHNELKSERELDKLKGLRLVELSLDRNPLCDHFKDQADYIRLVLILSCPSYFCSEELKSLILCFLQQYYTIYDSADRQPLLDAYHDGATFSLIIPFSMQNPSKCSLGEYQKDSRNIKRVRDSTTRFRLLKHTRLNVVAFLNELPKTHHDIASFNVDVNTYTNTLLSFTVSGVFKEVDGKSRDSYRAFSRVFIAVSPGNGTLCIVNDEMFIRNATTEEIRRAFVAPAPTPSSSPVPTLSATQQEMLSAFSLKSGMNLEWSQKCLQDNDWDFDRAAQIFTDLKVQGKIPDVAFIK
uniref:Nuclear RNA export factor 1 n=1 Tax=Pygocentrus nattereri TaxID=42514 RepID=A0AAR2IY77_PYGNA